MDEILERMEGVKEFYIGDMGIRKIYMGEELLFERKSNYIFLQIIKEGD